MLRYDPPVMSAGRQALEDRRIGGCPVEAGQTITVVLMAAIGFSEDVNRELIRRGILDAKPDADATIEARIDRSVAEVLDVMESTGGRAGKGMDKTDPENIRQALRVALLMVATPPVARPHR